MEQAGEEFPQSYLSNSAFTYSAPYKAQGSFTISNYIPSP